jgi:hypothetical protein
VSIGIKIALYVLLASGTIRALYIIMSYGSGGENSLDRPGLVIRYRMIPDIATWLLLVAIIVAGFVGYRLSGWTGLLITLASTAFIGCPLIGMLLKKRPSKASMYYYSNPFLQIVLLLPIFLVVSILFSL